MFDFHIFLKTGVKLHYENGFGNHQIAPRCKGIDQIYVIDMYVMVSSSEDSIDRLDRDRMIGSWSEAPQNPSE